MYVFRILDNSSENRWATCGEIIGRAVCERVYSLAIVAVRYVNVISSV